MIPEDPESGEAEGVLDLTLPEGWEVGPVDIRFPAHLQPVRMPSLVTGGLVFRFGDNVALSAEEPIQVRYSSGFTSISELISEAVTPLREELAARLANEVDRWTVGAFQGDWIAQQGEPWGRLLGAFLGAPDHLFRSRSPAQADPLKILERMALERAPGELTIEPLRANMVGLLLRKDGRESRGIVDLDVLVGAGGDYEKALRAKVARLEGAL